jgi:hypothetical protein
MLGRADPCELPVREGDTLVEGLAQTFRAGVERIETADSVDE